MAAMLTLLHQIRNLTLSIEQYFHEEQSCQTASRLDLKWRSPNKNKNNKIAIC